MLVRVISDEAALEEPTAAWGAVFALSIGAFALVASEFMPVSLLTPIASDLHISEGQAGQAISVSGAFAVLASLFLSAAVGRLDRKVLLLALTGLMIVSGTVVAAAPNSEIFMVGRAFIGIAIGGFWSMSAATAMRLVPADKVPRALAILNGGNALATVVAAPMGSLLGGLIGWRGAFFFVVPIAAIVFVWQFVSLPSMKPAVRTSANFFRLMNDPVVVLGMVAVSLFFMGQFTLFTYLRPFLEAVVHVDVTMLSLMLLIMGVSGFVGTMLIGFLLDNHIYRTLVVFPVVMAGVASSLVFFAGGAVLTMGLLALWGFLATSAPVAWWTWVARALPNDAEAGGGLMVAIVQLAITMGAVLGGLLYDAHGYQATFGVSAIILLVGSVLAMMTSLAARRASRPLTN